MQLVEPVVHVVEGAGQVGVAVGVGVHGQPVEAHRLVGHRLQQPVERGRDRGAVQPAGGLGDVDHEVARALDLRGEPDGGDDGAHVAGHRLLPGEDREAALLDVEGELVDLVVAVDDRLRLGQVEGEERLGAAGDRLGDPRRRPQQVALHLVELVVEREAGVGHRCPPPTGPQRRGGPVRR